MQTEFDSGVVCFHIKHAQLRKARNRLSDKCTTGEFGFALAFFSNSVWNADRVMEFMSTSAGDLRYAACSTAGELTPDGMKEGDLLIILFPNKNFEIECFQLAGGDNWDMQSVVTQVTTYKARFFNKAEEKEASQPVAICLTDGLSNNEEAVAAALHMCLDDVPLLGGSAGDNLNFNNTSLIINGEIVRSSAVILFIKSKLEFEVFKTENFVPTREKLVVTRSEPDKRLVKELNGISAVEAYSQAIGRDPLNLAPESFASHPLVVKVGGEYYCRSIQKMNNDGSLTFFCAIDDGVVLTVAEPTGMVASTRNKLGQIEQKLGKIDFVLGFDCVLRQIDAVNRQVTHRISETYRNYNVIGFNTYGEQYNSMHLNQTLTGVAFGKSIQEAIDVTG